MRFRVWWVFFFSIALMVFMGAPIAVADPGQPLSLEDVMRLAQVRQASISPDGRWIVYVVRTADLDQNRFNDDLWLVEARPDATPRRMTWNPKRDDSPAWSPDGSWIAFLSERNEDKAQIYLIRPDGGEARRVTESETGVVRLAWAPDSRRIAYLAPQPETKEEKERKKKEGDARVVDEEFKLNRLHVVDITTGEVRDLARDFAMHIDNLDWSPDGNALVISARPTPRVPDYYRTDLYLVSLEGDTAPRPLVRQAGLDTAPRWSPDGHRIAFLTNGGRRDWNGNVYLAWVSPEGGEVKIITRSFDERIQSFRWSPDGRSLYFEAGHRIARHVWWVSLDGGEVRRITPGMDVWSNFSLDRSGNRMAVLHQDPEHPAEVYLLVRGRQGRFESVQALTDSNPWLRERRLGTTELITWKGPEDVTIEGLVVKPVNFQEGKRFPLLLVVHGGPAGVFTRSFYGRRGAYPIQVFAGRGYMVLLPNPRGSGYYGEKFRKMNYRDWGGRDYRDLMAGVDALNERGWADPARLGVMGWSYGGFMTSWIITQTDRFRAASVGAGVTDLFSMYGTTDIPDFMEAHFGVPPWEDPMVYLEHSAMWYVKNVRTPTLIQHGDRDVRVPTSQSWELYRALKRLGVTVRFVIYPRQPHGVREPRLIRSVMKENLQWFQRWIPTEAVAASR